MATPKATVLLVGATPSQARMIRDTLAASTGGPYQLSHASRLGDALQILARIPCDVVLVDSPLPDAPPNEALSSIVAAAQGAGIVLLVRPANAELGRGALSSGAHAFLLKDDCWELDGARIMRAIDVARAARRSTATQPPVPAPRARPRGTVLSFLGAKGGTATTSIALRVARALAERGTTTILVELRSWPGSVAETLGLKLSSQLDQLTGLERLEPQSLDQILTTVDKNLKVLLAPASDDEAHGMNQDQTRRLLDALTRMAGRVVLDLPCEATPALEVAVQASSFVSIVTEAESACVRQARRVVQLIEGWSVGVAQIGAVVVYRTPSSIQDLAALRAALGADILATLPVPPGCRVLLRKGEEATRVAGTEALGLCLRAMVDRLDTQDAVPVVLGGR